MGFVRRHSRQGRSACGCAGRDALRLEQIKTIRSGGFGIVSAERPEYSRLENDERTLALQRELEMLGRPFCITGAEPGSGEANLEASFVVKGMSESEALELGRRWDQGTVIVGSKLIDPKDAHVVTRFDPGKTVFGPAAMKEPYWTIIRDTGLVFSLREHKV